MPPQTFFAIMNVVFHTLNLLHLNGVTHNDIREPNIFYNTKHAKVVLGDFGICRTKHSQQGIGIYCSTDYIYSWGLQPWWDTFVSDSHKKELIQDKMFKIFHRDKWACILILCNYYDSRVLNLTTDWIQSSAQTLTTEQLQLHRRLDYLPTPTAATNQSIKEELTFLNNIVDYLLDNVFLRKRLLPYVDFENSVVFQPTTSKERNGQYENILNNLPKTAPKEPTPRPPWRSGGSPVEENGSGQLDFTNQDGTYYYEPPMHNIKRNTIVLNGGTYIDERIPISKTKLLNPKF